MSQRNSPTAWRVRRSHEPNRLADRQLVSAYDAVLLSTSGTPPPMLSDVVTAPPTTPSRDADASVTEAAA